MSAFDERWSFETGRDFEWWPFIKIKTIFGLKTLRDPGLLNFLQHLI